MPQDIYLILHNIRSLYNVGSLFRTADGAGVKQVYLTGYTGYPPRKEISKTALGAELSVPWERYETLPPLLAKLRAEGIQVVAVERSAQSQHYLQVPYQARVALILGNEVTGLDPEIQNASEYTIHIPMYGHKESLNVAVCGGILVYGLRELFTRV